MRLSYVTFAVLAPVCALVHAAELVDYPPATRLKDQVLVGKDAGTRGDAATRPHVNSIQRGYEAISFALAPEHGRDARGTTSVPPVGARWVVYDTAQKRIIPLEKPPEAPATDRAKTVAPAAEEKLPPGVKKEQLDRWVMWEHWRNSFKDAKREDLLEQAKLQDGYVCFARDGKAGEPAELFIHRPVPLTLPSPQGGEGGVRGEPLKLCDLEKHDGQTLSQAVWLRVMRSGDIAVLAANEKLTVLQVYEHPLLATFCAQWNALMDHGFKAGSAVVKARYLGSLYDYSEFADRAFDPILVASDGKAYFGTMPHHATEGGPVFSFDPKAEKFALLGDIDRMAGPRQPSTSGSMVHSNACELNGKVYFTGEDPHYGGWDFPREPGQEKPKYPGSPVVEYGLGTGKARGLGIPFPGNPGIFQLNGDAKRNVLYIRRGYARDYAGPLAWFALQLDANGNIAGEPKRLPLELHPPQVLVAADGTIFGAVPEQKTYAEFAEKKAKREKTDGIAPQCEIWRMDAELRKAEKVATVPETWEIQWLPWQDGKPAALGLGEQFVYRLDLRSGAVEKLCPWLKVQAGGHPPVALHDGKIICLAWVQPKTRAGRTTGVFTLDLATGKALFHGVIVDEAGRRPKDLNHFALLPDGRIFAVGTVYGLPTDKHSMTRYRDGEPYRLDCAGFLIEKLPPGVPVPQ